MVNVYLGDILPKLRASQPGKRMPLLCALNRSFGWRILSENNEEHEKGVRSEIIDLNNNGFNEDYLSTMAVSDSTGVVAIASGSSEGSLYFVRDLSAISDVDLGPRFKILHKEALGAPIHSLDWSGNHLLVGTNQGISKAFEVEIGEDRLEKFTCIGQYINDPSQISVYAPSFCNLNTHVKSVEFSPNYSSKGITSTTSKDFLTTTMNRVSIWDLHQSDEPIKHYQASSSLLNCASWSPNDPQSLIACGGCDKKLIILDTRIPSSEHGGIVWSVDNAHDRPIRDAKFNPYIPYWLASTGEDSIVNIWDIRASYRAPVAKIDGSLGIVTSVTWSNIRPENIGTTSSDGVMRYWTLTPENFPLWDTHYKVAHFSEQDTLPITREFEDDNIWCIKGQIFKDKKQKSWIDDDGDEGIEQIKIRSTKLLAGSIALGEWGKPDPGTIYKGEENVQSKGAVVMMKPAKLRPSMYYCITSGGQLAAHTVRFDAQSNLRSRHRYDPEDKNEIAAQIEDDIYCRRVSEANRKLDILKNTSTKDEQEEKHRLEDIEFLEDCLKLRMPIKGSEWKFDSIPDKSNRRVSRRLWNDEDKWDMAIQTFKTDLKYWSYRIPPGFDKNYKFPLEFKDPIIAPHLLEKELVPTELPPFIDPSPRLAYPYSPNDVLSQPLSPMMDDDELTEEDDSKPVLVYTHPTGMEEDGALGIRRLSHTPPVLTVNDTGKVSDSEEHDDKRKSSTPPLNALVPDADSPMITQSTNPFENNVAQEQKPEVPQSTNPFDIPSEKTNENFQQAVQSTNPFEQEVAAPISNEPDTYLTRANTEKENKKRNSWVSAGHRLSLNLSRHSLSSNVTTTTMDEDVKTPSKKHRFNPFKRIISRNSTTTEDEAEERIGSFNSNNASQNDSSSRRNALHGPF